MIAYNAGSTGGTGSGTSTTVASPDVQGSNRMGVVWVTCGGADTLNSLTWDGVNIFGNLVTKIKLGSYNNYSYGFLYYAPPIGVTNIVAGVSSANNINLCIESYTGVTQSNTPDASITKNQTSGTSISENVTTVADNAWLVSATTNVGTSVIAGANTTYRHIDGVNNQINSGDSNADQTPAGSHAQGFSWSGSDNNSLMIISISPATATPATATTDKMFLAF